MQNQTPIIDVSNFDEPQNNQEETNNWLNFRNPVQCNRRKTLFSRSINKIDMSKNMIEIHQVKTHDQMVILFATLLLKLNRLKDSFTVLNTYGRKCLHEDKLTRANMYKLLAMTSLETRTDGSTEKALKHCDKAIEKFKFLESKEGIASWLILKSYILQITKYTEDPYESDEDEGELVESSTSIGKSSKIRNIIEQAIHLINLWDVLSPNVKRKWVIILHSFSIIIDLRNSVKKEEILDFEKTLDLTKFIQNPIFILHSTK